MSGHRTVSVVTLGCARNEVDSEELAARLEGSGWTLVPDADEASVVLVNTCGFVEAAKQESIETVLDAADGDTKVVAVGCLAERYGAELARALPEADAVLGFDDYREIGRRLDDVLAGRSHVPHTRRDRRRLLPLIPADRRSAGVHVPGHASPAPGSTPGSTSGSTSGRLPVASVGDLPEGVAPASGPRPLRRRLDHGPVAPLKIASGCDRRCTFCAIPAFRGAFVSRPPDEVLAEAHWLAGRGVRELVLVSENSTSYGKDLGDLRLLEKLLPDLAAVPGIVRVRVSYLQPAEVRPGLIEAMTSTPGVAPYFDLSFQHASSVVLRRMRRFGDRERFLALLGQIRERCPDAGVRSNFILGFPGETRADVAELERFLTAACLDGIGLFGYSAEDGTEAATYPGRVRSDTVARRLDRVRRLVDELTAQRAEDRVGAIVDVLVEHQVSSGSYEGRAAHQAPEVDGGTTLRGAGLTVGDLVRARIREARGVDLVADPLEVVSRA